MGHNDPLLQILILLTASVCVVAAVRKLALPAILGYLAVGMLLGPHALSLAAGNETTQLLADFGVVFLVFTLGLEFSLPRLVAMRWEVLGVGGAQVLITVAIVACGAVVFLDVAPAVAVVIGGARNRAESGTFREPCGAVGGAPGRRRARRDRILRPLGHGSPRVLLPAAGAAPVVAGAAHL